MQKPAISAATEELRRRYFLAEADLIMDELSEHGPPIPELDMPFDSNPGPEALKIAAERRVERDFEVAFTVLTRRLSRAALATAKARRDLNRLQVGQDFDSGAAEVDMCGLMLDVLLTHIFEGSESEINDPATRVVADIVQTAQTTVYAIGLLLQHGYLADAEARWRGLYELTCSLALISRANDVEQISLKYLVHGGRMAGSALGAKAPWYSPDFRAKQSEWLRGDYAHNGKSGKPLAYSQAWLFRNAGLRLAPPVWVLPSHQAVHMTSIAVAGGGSAHGARPPGYSQRAARVVAGRTAYTLAELVAHSCLVIGTWHWADDAETLVWPQVFLNKVDDVQLPTEDLYLETGKYEDHTIKP